MKNYYELISTMMDSGNKEQADEMAKAMGAFINCMFDASAKTGTPVNEIRKILFNEIKRTTSK